LIGTTAGAAIRAKVRKPTHLRLSAAVATTAIRERSRDSANVVLTFRAQDRMQERDISATEVFRMAWLRSRHSFNGLASAACLPARWKRHPRQ